MKERMSPRIVRQSQDEMRRLPAALAVPESVLSACRAASLRIGTPNVTNLGITSTLRGEGRTSVAIAMAAVHRDDFGRSVVLVDLDLEGSTLARRLGADPVPGLSEVVRGECPLPKAIQTIVDGVSFIPAGVASGSIARTVTEAGKMDLIACLEREAGMVIADLPPLLGSDSGRSAASLFGDLLLVVRAGVTPVPRMKEAIANLPVEPTVLLNATRSQLPRWMKRIIGD
jgi:MinD-like ATPase involved in chromosome partitioning or flagellar assembly